MKYVIILLIIILPSCVYDFEPNTSNYENKLVVYCLLTNEVSQVKVSLTRTTSLSSKHISPEENAEVFITSSKGDTFLFTEDKYGNYYSIENFAAEQNVLYKLHITTSDGNVYGSEEEEVTTPVEIGDLYYQYYQYENDEIGQFKGGYQFYLDAKFDNNKKNYLRYNYDETWEIWMPLTATHKWDPVDSVYNRVSLSSNCWYNEIIDDFHVLNTYEYGSNNVTKLPLAFVSEESSRLNIKYCLNVRQYTLSDEAFEYWNLQKKNQLGNSLYSTQPFKVTGNIKNLNNPDDYVVGLFEVSGFTTKRVFAEGLSSVEPEFDDCEYMDVPENKIHPYYVYMSKGQLYLATKNCVVCEVSGASPIMPDFWQ